MSVKLKEYEADLVGEFLSEYWETFLSHVRRSGHDDAEDVVDAIIEKLEA